MVMGHTIQGAGINAACEGRALRIDTGMSRGCGNGEVEVLELRKDGQQVRVIEVVVEVFCRGVFVWQLHGCALRIDRCMSQGINTACEGRALRIDMGMSRGCGNGEIEVLEHVKVGSRCVWVILLFECALRIDMGMSRGCGNGEVANLTVSQVWQSAAQTGYLYMP